MKTARVSAVALTVGLLACVAFGDQTSTWAVFKNAVSTVDGNLAETFNLGTFAVVERACHGMAIIFR